MGATFMHECNRCEYLIWTSGPWEFYRNILGVRKPYGHPGPISTIAKKHGISGLCGECYCPKCDKNYDIVLIEIKRPIRNRWRGPSIWEISKNVAAYKNRIKEVWDKKCPKCGYPDILPEFLGLNEEKEIICPKCKEGILQGKVFEIS